MLSENDSKIDRYKKYEAAYLSSLTDQILQDEGESDLSQLMKAINSEFKQSRAEELRQQELRDQQVMKNI